MKGIVNDVIEAYNKEAKIQAKLISVNNSTIIIEFMSKRNDKRPSEKIKKGLEAAMKVPVIIDNSKFNNESQIVSFVLKKEKSPIDDILGVLDKYYEGTPERKGNFED